MRKEMFQASYGRAFKLLAIGSSFLGRIDSWTLATRVLLSLWIKQFPTIRWY